VTTSTPTLFDARQICATTLMPFQPSHTKVKTLTSPAASSTLNSTNPRLPSSAIRSRGSSAARAC
jgi:hypothetical protein